MNKIEFGDCRETIRCWKDIWPELVGAS
jgi:hypothetical protein